MRMRALVALLVVGLTLGLAGCGGDDNGSSATTTTGTSATAGGDVAAGREVFISTGCGTCHTVQEAGTDGAVGPNLNTDLVLDADAAGAPLAEYVRTSIVDPDAWVMPRYSGGVMPTNYGSQLSDTQVDDLVAFIVQSAQ